VGKCVTQSGRGGQFRSQAGKNKNIRSGEVLKKAPGDTDGAFRKEGAERSMGGGTEKGWHT